MYPRHVIRRFLVVGWIIAYALMVGGWFLFFIPSFRNEFGPFWGIAEFFASTLMLGQLMDFMDDSGTSRPFWNSGYIDPIHQYKVDRKNEQRTKIAERKGEERYDKKQKKLKAKEAIIAQKQVGVDQKKALVAEMKREDEIKDLQEAFATGGCSEQFFNTQVRKLVES